MNRRFKRFKNKFGKPENLRKLSYYLTGESHKSTEMNNEKFTIEAAFEIQTAQVRKWKTVLKPEIYSMLLDKCIEENAKDIKSPYNVFRGQDINSFIINISYKLYSQS